ncbi:MAG: DUF2461 domain-containing protein [Saprospiraceae bacterium]|nr:DUF2461 domain-containing protein [Saprospiraceae bacterium]
MNHEFLQFFYELSQNNNRDWFEKNKARYEATVKKPFAQLVGELIQRIQTFDSGYDTLQAKDCVFRIHRDTRFSADKTPYKTHASAVFVPKGKRTMEDMSFPGYYLQLSFGSLSLGGGAYFLDKPALHQVRTAILQNPSYFHQLLENKDFVEKYGSIQGEKNKVMPPEFKEAAKAEPLLYHKQFYFMAEVDPELSLRPDFADLVAAYFRAGQALNAYFRSALKG